MDYFALLKEPRRPWIDANALKQKFLSLSETAHPDRVKSGPGAQTGSASQHFADLNAAYNTLRNPKDRLRHLLELERGTKPGELQQIPPDLTEKWLEIGQVCRDVDAFLRQKSGAASALVRVQLFEEGQSWANKLMSMRQGITASQEQLLAQLKRLDEHWLDPDLARRAAILNELETLYRLFGFYDRWSAQIQERIVLLSL